MDTADFFARLDDAIVSTGMNDNPLYERFRRGGISREQLERFSEQYFYYIRTFPQILAGLAARVEEEAVRVELAKTIVSELGNGEPGKIHFQLFENAIAPMGVKLADIDDTPRIPVADALVDGIRDLFLRDSTFAAIGGHYTIELAGLPMISSMYEGFRTFPESTIESMEYFYLHLLVEHEHVEWITAAVSQHLDDPASIAEIERGALVIGNLLREFWNGLYAHAFADELTPAG